VLVVCYLFGFAPPLFFLLRRFYNTSPYNPFGEAKAIYFFGEPDKGDDDSSSVGSSSGSSSRTGSRSASVGGRSLGSALSGSLGGGSSHSFRRAGLAVGAALRLGGGGSGASSLAGSQGPKKPRSAFGPNGHFGQPRPCVLCLRTRKHTRAHAKAPKIPCCARARQRWCKGASPIRCAGTARYPSWRERMYDGPRGLVTAQAFCRK